MYHSNSIGNATTDRRRAIPAGGTRQNGSPQDLDHLLDYRTLYTAALEQATQRGEELTALCPFHNDHHPSLSVNLRTGKYHCHACGASGNYVRFVAELQGIGTAEAYRRICEENRIPFSGAAPNVEPGTAWHPVARTTEMPVGSPRSRTSGTKAVPAHTGDWSAAPQMKSSSIPRKKPAAAQAKRTAVGKQQYTLADYAAEKCLPVAFLEQVFHMERGRGGAGGSWLKLPYLDGNGTEVARRRRNPPGTEPRFQWASINTGAARQLFPYGLWLTHAPPEETAAAEAPGANPGKPRKTGKTGKAGKYLVLVEGESDVQTLTYLGIPALGFPGATTFKESWIEYLSPYDTVYLHREPDRGGEQFIDHTLDVLGKGGYRGTVKIFTCGTPENGNAKDPSAYWCALCKASAISFDGDSLSDPDHTARVRAGAAKTIRSLLERAEQITLPDGKTELPGSGIRFFQPEGWQVTMEGIFQLDQRSGELQLVSTTPILVRNRIRKCPEEAEGSEVSKNLNNVGHAKTERMLLTIYLDGQWKDFEAGRSDVFGAKGAQPLTEYGVDVCADNGRLVSRFLRDLQIANEIPMLLTTDCCGWKSDDRFQPYGTTALQWSDDAPEIVHSLKTHGTVERWAANMAPYRKNNTFRLLLAAAFAAPLLKPLGCRNLWLHLRGRSRKGKTAALRCAATVWGNPDRLVSSFNNTRNYLASLCYACNDLPVFINEKQVLGNNATLDDTIYSVLEGVSRGRLNQDATQKKQFRWRTVCISNGEETLISDQSHDGVATRVLELTEPPFGDAIEAEKTAAGTYRLTGESYGVAGQAFVENLLYPGTLPLAREFYNDLSDRLQAEFPERTYQCASAALLCTADYLAELQFFHGLPENPISSQDPMGSALELAQALIHSQDALAAEDESTRVLQFLQDYILENKASIEDFLYTGELEARKSNKFLGFVKDGYINLIPNPLRDALRSAGFSPKTALGMLVEAKVLRRDKGQRTVKVGYHETKVRVYSFFHDRVFSGNPPEDDDLPFIELPQDTPIPAEFTSP